MNLYKVKVASRSGGFPPCPVYQTFVVSASTLRAAVSRGVMLWQKAHPRKHVGEILIKGWLLRKGVPKP